MIRSKQLTTVQLESLIDILVGNLPQLSGTGLVVVSLPEGCVSKQSHLLRVSKDYTRFLGHHKNIHHIQLKTKNARKVTCGVCVHGEAIRGIFLFDSVPKKLSGVFRVDNLVEIGHRGVAVQIWALVHCEVIAEHGHRVYDLKRVVDVEPVLIINQIARIYEGFVLPHNAICYAVVALVLQKPVGERVSYSLVNVRDAADVDILDSSFLPRFEDVILS